MGLFKKQKPDPEQPVRRRSVYGDDAANRPQAFSYYAKRSNPGASTGRGQTDASASTFSINTTIKSRVALILGSIVAIIGVGYSLHLSSNAKIVPLTSSGNAYFLQDTSVYEKTVENELQSSIFNKNKLTVNTSGIARDLTINFPEISKASITLPIIGSNPTVYIEPYRPTFVLTTLDNTAFLLDENGKALVSTSHITDPGELDAPVLQDKSGTPVRLGSQALPRSIIRFTEEVISLLEAAGVDYSSLVLPPASSELDVYIEGKPYFVKFNLQDDSRQQVGTFLATKLRLEKDKITPAQYIDVRLSERAYYR